MDGIKIVPLMEDNLCGEGLIAEHGLSLYIETPRHKLLVDTGQSEKTWGNAAAKGVDITGVDTVFLSHGHYDHSGGLMKFASINPNAKIYMRRNAGGDYYSFKDGEEKYIGIDKNILGLPKINLIDGNTVLDDELSVFTNVKPIRFWPKGNLRLHELKTGKFIQDSFSHEMYLVIKFGEKEYALISGCAHNGILNILDSFRGIYKTEPKLVVSGFHMIQSEYDEADISQIEKIGDELSRMNTIFYSGHCTGETAYGLLKNKLGDKLQAIREL